MSKLEIGSVKYDVLNKWKTLGNKAENEIELKNVLAEFHTLVNDAMKNHYQEHIKEEKSKMKKNKARIPFFTDEKGKAVQAVKSMQKKRKLSISKN